MGDVIELRRCTCMEVEGEDPNCPLHEMTVAKLAAWEDWECATTDLDGYTARAVARKHLDASGWNAALEAAAEIVDRFGYDAPARRIRELMHQKDAK
jgi:hypothetical protein